MCPPKYGMHSQVWNSQRGSKIFNIRGLSIPCYGTDRGETWPNFHTLQTHPSSERWLHQQTIPPCLRDGESWPTMASSRRNAAQRAKNQTWWEWCRWRCHSTCSHMAFVSEFETWTWWRWRRVKMMVLKTRPFTCGIPGSSQSMMSSVLGMMTPYYIWNVESEEQYQWTYDDYTWSLRAKNFEALSFRCSFLRWRMWAWWRWLKSFQFVCLHLSIPQCLPQISMKTEG